MFGGVRIRSIHGSNLSLFSAGEATATLHASEAFGAQNQPLVCETRQATRQLKRITFSCCVEANFALFCVLAHSFISQQRAASGTFGRRQGAFETIAGPALPRIASTRRNPSSPATTEK